MKPKPLKDKWKTSLLNREWCKYCCWYDMTHKKCSIVGHPDDFSDDITLSHTALCHLNWKLNKVKYDVKSAVKLLLQELDDMIKNCEHMATEEHPKWRGFVYGLECAKKEIKRAFKGVIENETNKNKAQISKQSNLQVKESKHNKRSSN